MTEPRVCVLGAGLSGLAATKELRELGVAVECHDMLPILGGTFGSYTWKGGRLTSSTISTWFSDFPVEDRQHFMTWREFVDYLEAYVDAFGFRECIQLDSKATAITRTPSGWRIRFHRADHGNGHPFHPADHRVEEAEFERQFTHLILSTGLHHTPHVPAIPGLEGFTGTTLHSREYRDAEQFRGQRVIVVGAGESGSDIAEQIAGVARECTLSFRSAPGTLFPKWIQGNTPDIRDDRITYNLPRGFKPIILRGHRRFYSIQREDPELFAWAARSNFENQRCSFNSNACKSFGIPRAIVELGAIRKPGIRAIAGTRVEFDDETSVEADAIIFATGFQTVFPLLEPALAAMLTPINRLWKNAVHPELGAALMLIGFARPHQINLITTSELQARMAALVISGRKPLPSPAAMRETIAIDQAFMRRYYGDRYRNNPALVDQLYFTDSLAEFIGCGVPWREVLRRDPELALKLIYGAIHGAHHRLVGPGANWALAARTIKATPRFANTANAVMRWTVLSLLTGVAWAAGKIEPEARLIGRRVRS